MAEQSAGGGGFVKAFLPGLALGLVIGGLAGAFLGPMVSNPPEPVGTGRSGVPMVIPAAPGTFDERAPVKPEAPADGKKSDDGAAPDPKVTPPEAPKPDAPKPDAPKPSDPKTTDPAKSPPK